MAARSDRYIAARDWCLPVADDQELASHPRGYLRLDPARIEALAPPQSLYLHPSDSLPAEIGADRDDEAFGFRLRQGGLWSDETFVASLTDVVWRDRNLTRTRDSQLFVTPDLALGESWFHPAPADLLSQRFGAGFRGQTVLGDGTAVSFQLAAATK